MMIRLLVSILLVAVAAAQKRPYTGPAEGSYGNLRPEQKKLVQAWLTEFGRITGKKLDVATYESLTLSTRTTFDAVTHALLNTPLTAENGTSLGKALDLVEMVESAHGQLPGSRGDHQFRLYVKLKKNALDRLYASKEFKRTGDNTIYHLGYPINFRQQGGTPSIQISVTRTGRRADIDVDYRSSSGPKALVNGHLTAANSDVRAGNNPRVHARRWNGFEEWWRDFLGLFAAPAQTVSVALNIPVPDTPRVKASAPLEDAVHDYLQSWLVDGKPEQAFAYLSIVSYACLAEFQTGESIDSNLANLRILEQMRKAARAYGRVNSLEEVVQGAPLYAPGARPIQHPHGKLFSVEQLADDDARALDCRVRLKTDLAEELPAVSHQFGDKYASITRLRRENGGPTYLTQVWSKEEGYWKVVSWHLEHPFQRAAAPATAPRPAAAASRAKEFRAEPELIQATEDFFATWLQKRDFAKAAAYFAPEASGCSEIRDAGAPAAFLSGILAMLPRQGGAELIAPDEHSHPHLQEVPHRSAQMFLLARVSDDLAAMSECGAGYASRSATAGRPAFRTGRFQTIARLKVASGLGGAINLQWTKRDGNWQITAAHIVTH